MVNFKKFLDERNLTEDYIEEVIRQNAMRDLEQHAKNGNKFFYFVGIINLFKTEKGVEYWSKHSRDWTRMVRDEKIIETEKEKILEYLKKM